MEDDDGDTKMKKALPKSHKKIKFVGSAPPDEFFPHKSGWRVLEENGTVWDAMLNQTQIAVNANKFYKQQVLTDDTSFAFFTRWGRVGQKGQNKVLNKSKEECKKLFEDKFRAKTLNEWSERDSFIPCAGKYTLLDIDYGDREKSTSGDPWKRQQEGAEAIKSQLAPEIQELVQLIFDKKMMERELKEIGYDAAKLPLGRLSDGIISKAYAVLKALEQRLEREEKRKKEREKEKEAKRKGKDKGKGSRSKGTKRQRAMHRSALNEEEWESDDILDLSSRYYTLIPHVFGMRQRPPPINNRKLLNQEMKLIEALAEVRVATELLKQGSPSKGKVKQHPVDEHFDLLKCDMEVIPKKSKEFKMLEQYVELTHAETHNRYSLEVETVYKMDRHGSNKRFKQWEKDSNRMLLWHGSRLTNFVGIISQGLRIAPPEAPVTGYMFGKGVYFADMSSKSANYCFTTPESNTGLLLLCEVALGGMNELTRADYYAEEAMKENGKQSTKGLGSTSPDQSTFVTLDNGCVVPSGKSVKDRNLNTSLLYNEYIVYDTAQIRMKYLLRMKFNYDQEDDGW